MAGVFPDSGVPAQQASNSVDVATTGCTELFHSTTRCKPRFDPASANAVISELLNSVAAAGLTYDCGKLNNLALAIQAIADAAAAEAADAAKPCGLPVATPAQAAQMDGLRDHISVCINGVSLAVSLSELATEILPPTAATPCTATAATPAEVAAMTGAEPFLTCIGGAVRSVTRDQIINGNAQAVHLSDCIGGAGVNSFTAPVDGTYLIQYVFSGVSQVVRNFEVDMIAGQTLNINADTGSMGVGFGAANFFQVNLNTGLVAPDGTPTGGVAAVGLYQIAGMMLGRNNGGDCTSARSETSSGGSSGTIELTGTLLR